MFQSPAMRTTNMERATLKVEIPFTDHAHCIGRQGNQIQSIMSATDTHIHFPDGNREPNGTKSNQVRVRVAFGMQSCTEPWASCVGVDHGNHCIDRGCAQTHSRNLTHVVEISHSTDTINQYHQRRLSSVQECPRPLRRHRAASSVRENRRCLLHRSRTVSARLPTRTELLNALFSLPSKESISQASPKRRNSSFKPSTASKHRWSK